MGYRNAKGREAMVGDVVVYRSHLGAEPRGRNGVRVVDCDPTLAFVKYANQRENAPGKATRTTDLEVRG